MRNRFTISEGRIDVEQRWSERAGKHLYHLTVPGRKDKIIVSFEGIEELYIEARAAHAGQGAAKDTNNTPLA